MTSKSKLDECSYHEGGSPYRDSCDCGKLSADECHHCLSTEGFASFTSDDGGNTLEVCKNCAATEISYN